MCMPYQAESGTVKMITRFGKHSHIQPPGLGMLILPCCCVDGIAGTLSMRVQQVDVVCTTKTLDNVFVKVEVAVQYLVAPGQEYNAFYKLSNAQHQIESYVYDSLRSEVPKVTLDNLFVVKEQLAGAVKKTVGDAMESFGFQILATPVTDIDPDPGVKQAMNEINRQERLKKAASDKGEAAKILAIKEAEATAEKIRIEAQADADSKFYAGEGLSRQRQAIVDGLHKSVNLFTEGVHGAKPGDVMDMIMITQYFDTLKELGGKSGASTVFIPHQPGAIADISAQMRQGILEAQVVAPAAQGGMAR